MTLLEQEFERDVPWSTVVTNLSEIYAKDRSNPTLKNIAGTAKARGILLGSVRRNRSLARETLAQQLGLPEQLVFCAEHGLAVTAGGPVFDTEDRYDRLKAFHLQIAEHLGVDSQKLEQTALRYMMEELGNNE